MDEQYYEKLLNIKTSGEQKIFNDSSHYYRYEPTSYYSLETLSKHYKFTAEDSIVDFGCGKGRFNFYINHFFGSSVKGIEMNNFFYKEAIENKKSYFQTNKSKKDNINFLNCFAERYNIDPSDNKFYFFNPFSMQIFAKVIKNILVSTEVYERTVDVILYYPSSDYIYFLNTNSTFLLIDEIKVPNMYDNDPRHCFLIYRAGYYQ
ncbi:class I SAM-dependent methyltransferase [Acetivibrio cellulolyticus]|uniref:SAM-dependent methyltransferase n=1 Tax=Acetivibrio cellulolyticus TaxID=35830 RepID=UPI0001E2EB86|nr:SAM-dependent methyltransferase [Acetivibrio cellulolyticus]